MVKHFPGWSGARTHLCFPMYVFVQHVRMPPSESVCVQGSPFKIIFHFALHRPSFCRTTSTCDASAWTQQFSSAPVFFYEQTPSRMLQVFSKSRQGTETPISHCSSASKNEHPVICEFISPILMDPRSAIANRSNDSETNMLPVCKSV